MKTKHIGIKQLRQELFKVADDIAKSKRQYVVYRRNEPIFTIDPADEDAALYTPEAIASIERGMEDVRHGRTITLDQLQKKLDRRSRTESSSARKQKRK